MSPIGGLTHVHNHPYVIEFEGETRSTRKSDLDPVTSVLGFSVNTVDLEGGPLDTRRGYGNVAESGDLEQSSHAIDGQLADATFLEQLAGTRIALLAKRYVENKLSREEAARLAIVDASLSHLAPRVTSRDFEVLEEIRLQLADETRKADESWDDLAL